MNSNDGNDESIRAGDPPYRPLDVRETERPARAGKSPADPNRKMRAIMRIVAEVFFAGVGLILIFTGQGQLINGLIPVPWFGGLLIGVAVLGFLGVNVFARGPLDYRLDDNAAPPTGRNEEK